ncbi:efflux RND transporter periplasmic adaptor subunit [Marinihelvus fidelis]|uniref:Efflux RND transporter periplasmic adaptor subunit n=1 Tax=Marinihelvus fidelis TaxID=2613842 RepID=A0A5N0TEX0_9GAMM|nr:efflux RND transporter periplasmic adaptor subunit [Marinihelvus fidelis]KAA9133161.1 efflux RND transporter periplasmic adaptor subunit [Marinihelvus fidelis]
MNTPRLMMESNPMNTLKLWAVCLCLALPVNLYAQETDHDEHDEEDGGAIELTAEEQRGAGIVPARVGRRALSETVRVPGEVVINAYRSSRVTSRITAQVVARHVTLGERVEEGQVLVTLSSVEMAEAQGALVVADYEWQRVKSLGRQTVSERRYTEAQVAQQQALAKVIAYGMTESQAAALAQSGDPGKATGAFDMLAPQAGTVLQDDFIVGELIEPGRVLVDITDESVMWVEAQTTPGGVSDIDDGATARVSLDGINWLEGTVIQRHHSLDETTRTQGLRVEVENVGDQIHPGQFVQVEIVTATRAPVLAVPSAAITMIEGSPAVFRLENGHEFHAGKIETGPTVGDWTVVLAGLGEGDEIAIDGVFHLKSLLLKSSLGEGHAH